jgi:hypothetical protein
MRVKDVAEPSKPEVDDVVRSLKRTHPQDGVSDTADAREARAQDRPRFESALDLALSKPPHDGLTAWQSVGLGLIGAAGSALASAAGHSIGVLAGSALEHRVRRSAIQREPTSANDSSDTDELYANADGVEVTYDELTEAEQDYYSYVEGADAGDPGVHVSIHEYVRNWELEASGIAINDEDEAEEG